MRRLAEGGVRLVTLTNGATANAITLLERAGLAGLVERSFSVEEVRRWKPAPEPYLHAAHESGVPPEACTLVAAQPWDIDGAKRAGLGGGWLNRRQSSYPEMFTPADAEGPTLGALAEELF